MSHASTERTPGTPGREKEVDLSDKKVVGRFPDSPKSALAETEAWNIARSMIQHEDTLIHQRMTHYLSIQAFLFTAVGLSLKEAISAKAPVEHSLWAAGIFILSVLAVWTGKLATQAIGAAVLQIQWAGFWWINTSLDNIKYKYGSLRPQGERELWDGSYPPIIGDIRSGGNFTTLLISALNFLWIALTILAAVYVMYLATKLILPASGAIAPCSTRSA